MKSRIADLSKKPEVGYVGWEFEGGKVEANTEANRLQIFFEEKPDEATRAELKSNSFRWSPTAEAWQRQLTYNAYFAANYIKSIQPLTGEKPTELQRTHIRAEQTKPQETATTDKPAFIPEYIYKVHANPRSDSRENLYFLQAYLTQENGIAKIGDVLYIGTPEKYRELMGQLTTEELTQEEVCKGAGAAADTGKRYLFHLSDKGRGELRPYLYRPLAPDMTIESIFERFNIDHPADFKGHSLSVFDVVVFHQNGQNIAHYVDSGAGFRQVLEFLQEQQKVLVPDACMTGEKVTTPRGTFHVTTMSREQMEAAGYGFHH